MKKLILLLTLTLFVSCTSLNHSSYSEKSTRKDKIMKVYKGWKGTPYKLGGNNKNGVDCSYFVMTLYKEAFSKPLPRTTKKQVKEGKKVSRRNLEVGDLIFFKTGWNVRHVAVYIGNNQFVHASSSKGVTISSFNKYWDKVYWQTRRVL